MMKIILLGLKGVGKTSFGGKLAERLGWPFVDTDEEIERRFGKMPREIFLSEGEGRLREIEHQVLGDLQNRGDCVIAVGGGSFITDENQKILRRLGRLICLHLNKASLLERWEEWPPICKSRNDFDNYYEERMQKLRELSCVWIDATRKDLLDLVMRVCDGK